MIHQRLHMRPTLQTCSNHEKMMPFSLLISFLSNCPKAVSNDCFLQREADASHWERLTFHLFIGSIELHTLWKEKSLHSMNIMLTNTINSVEQNAAITQGVSAYQTGGTHTTSNVVTHFRPWDESGSVLLNTLSAQHHD